MLTSDLNSGTSTICSEVNDSLLRLGAIVMEEESMLVEASEGPSTSEGTFTYTTTLPLLFLPII